MKKLILVVAAVILCLGSFAACGGEKSIFVVHRESGSGTRDGFESVIGFSKEELGSLKNNLETSSTNSVLTEVSKNINAIGYASYASVKQYAGVKALKFGGVQATADNIRNGSYGLQRPFVIVTKSDSGLNAAANDYYKFITSQTADTIYDDSDLVTTNDARAMYTTENSTISGTVKLEGSTSMEKVVKALNAEYVKLQPGVTITYTPSGSSAGIEQVKGGKCDIGLSSRALKTSETGVTGKTVCLDGIALVVNSKNTLSDITKENVKKIYLGTVAKFSEL